MKLEETPQTASTFGARPIEQPGKILRFVTGRNLRALVSEWLTSKHGLVWLLLIVFLANYGETWFETSSRMQGPITAT
jgi:hypothetical protein